MNVDLAFRNPWWVVFAATLGMIVGNSPMVLFTFGLFLKPVISDFGWDRTTFATAIFVSQVAGAASMPFVGKLIDTLGIRRVTLAFILLFSVATALLSQTRTSGQFILLYGIGGVAGSGRGPLAFAKAISERFEARRGLALGVSTTGLGIGAAVIPWITRLLIENVGWRGAYVGLGIITFAVSFPAVAFFIREPEHIANEASLSTRETPKSTVPGPQVLRHKMLMKSSLFWLLIVAGFLTSAALNGTFVHIVPLLTDRGLSIRTATSILSFSALALIGAQIISGYLLDRFFAGYIAALFWTVSALGILLLSIRMIGMVPLLGVVCIAFGLGAESNLAAFLVSRYFGLLRFSEIFGYVLGVLVLGNGSGPWVMARCYDFQHSYSLALGCFAFALILSTLLISRLGPYRYSSDGPLSVAPL